VIPALDPSERELLWRSPDGNGYKTDLVVRDSKTGEHLSDTYKEVSASSPRILNNWLFIIPSERVPKTYVIDWRTKQQIEFDNCRFPYALVNSVIVTKEADPSSRAEAMIGQDVETLDEIWREEGYFLHPHALTERGVLLRGRAPKRLTSVCDLEIVDANTGEILQSTSIQFGPVCAQTEKFLYFLSDGCVGELNLETLAVRKIETGLRCAKDFQILNDHILFQVPDEGNCEGGGCLYLQDIQSGEIVGRWAWPSTYDWARASHVEPIGEGYYGILLRNGEENKGWSYWRYFVFKPEELLETEPEVECEPLMVSFSRETDDNGDNRYRVSMPDDCEDLVTYIWQMEVGAHSCADIQGFSGLVEDKPFDEDFAGEIILDCRNIPFDGDKESLGAALVESGRSFCSQYKILDAIDHEPIRFRCEF
jgi:hypothetical protein